MARLPLCSFLALLLLRLPPRPLLRTRCCSCCILVRADFVCSRWLTFRAALLGWFCLGVIRRRMAAVHGMLWLGCVWSGRSLWSSRPQAVTASGTHVFTHQHVQTHWH